MATEIKVPSLGESVSEATVGKWLKNVGDTVSEDELLVELETDKITVEVNSPVSGVIISLNANEGDNVSIDAVIGNIGEGASAETQAPSEQKVEDAPSMEAVLEVENKPSEDSVAEEVIASPAAKKIANEESVELSQIDGSGKDGRITKEDVVSRISGETTKAVEPNVKPTPTPAPVSIPTQASLSSGEEQEERVRMSRLRQTIAKRLKDAQNTAAMLTTFNEVDMSEVMDIRSRYKETFEIRHEVKLGFMSFFVKACISALRDVPAVNSEIDGDDLIYKNYYHIGVAVGTDKGLVVPVVRNANNMSLADIEKEIARLSLKARDGSMAISDMMGGTFTISNGGVYGSLMSMPILNAPQSGILGMHKIQQRPIVVDGEIKIRPMMYLALSYDHRIVDGKEAVTFLVRVKENLEDPSRFVLDL